jgi:two-component system, OmpR family, sensor histidine kinase BaeS
VAYSQEFLGVEKAPQFNGSTEGWRLISQKGWASSAVMDNILQNACQYAPAGGRLAISTERIGDRFRVVFANTGGEITERDVPFIFERFYRGEKSRSREHGGAGIGLAIVKELVEAHGGEVGAEISQEETHVWFTLPR